MNSPAGVFLNRGVPDTTLLLDVIDGEHEDVAPVILSHIYRKVGLVDVGGRPLEQTDELPVRGEFLDSTAGFRSIVFVHNVDDARTPRLHAVNGGELPVSLAGAAPLRDEPTLGVEFLDAVVAAVADVDVFRLVHGDAERLVEVPSLRTLRPDLDDVVRFFRREEF
jgi:hypothetical protein